MADSVKTILISGSCGFIASTLIKEFYKNQNTKYRLVGIDKLVANHNIANIFEHPDYKFYLGDFADPILMNRIFQIEKPDIIFHLGAESFVQNSLENANKFIYSNVLGTQTIIDQCVKYNCELLYCSTDEVYSHHTSNKSKSWTEEFPPSPRNPYSASKYAAEVLIKAAHNTHGLKYKTTRSSNNYGKYQYRLGNLIPRIISSNLLGKPIPMHGGNLGKDVYREWIHAKDHASALWTVLEKGEPNQTYNVGTGFELSNYEMVQIISEIMKVIPKLESGSRPGLDLRYSVNTDKIRALGWEPKVDFQQGIEETIDWFTKNVKL